MALALVVLGALALADLADLEAAFLVVALLVLVDLAAVVAATSASLKTLASPGVGVGVHCHESSNRAQALPVGALG